MSAYMAETPNLNPSGKQQLRRNEIAIHAHRDIVGHQHFQTSLNLAFLHYQQLLASNTQDSNAAAANMFKLKGAQEFVHQFVYLAEELKPVAAPKDEGKLNYGA